MIKNIFYTMSVIAVVSTLIFVVGFGATFWITYDNQSADLGAPPIPQEPPQEVDRDGFNIVVLGDSLARGTGDENRLGYSGFIRETLKQSRDDVNYDNFAIDGLVSRGLLELINRENVKGHLEAADIILLSIGGNDLRTLPIQQAINPLDFNRVKGEFLANLEVILDTINSLNPSAHVALTGLYNPYQSMVLENLALLHQWNFETQKVVEQYPNMVFIPVVDLFKYNPEFVSIDRLHPNSVGYQAMAQRHLQTLREILK